ncbi:MAG: Dps family protein [Bauldia sp.]
MARKPSKVARKPAEAGTGTAAAASTAASRRTADLQTRANFSHNAVQDIAAVLNAVLADAFALFLKTKNFHWHVSGRHFRDYHLLLDDQAAQILATTDDLAERVRKVGGTTIRSIGHIARLQRIKDNDADFVTPKDMLAELREDNLALASRMRQAHATVSEHDDFGSSSMLEVWIDEAEKRNWFLFEIGRDTEG